MAVIAQPTGIVGIFREIYFRKLLAARLIVSAHRLHGTLVAVAAQLATERSAQVVEFLGIEGFVEIELQTHHIVVVAIAALSQFTAKGHVARGFGAGRRSDAVVGGSQRGSIEGVFTPPRVKIGGRHLIGGRKFGFQPGGDIGIEDKLGLYGASLLAVI